MMSSDSITYTSSEAIWAGTVGNSVVFIKSGLIGKFVLDIQDIVLLL